MGDPTRIFWLRRYASLCDDEEVFTARPEFRDLRRGSGYLRQLPDLHGEKEHRYEQATHEETRLHLHESPIDPYPQVPTWGDAFDDLVRDLLRHFGPAVKLLRFETKRPLEACDASEDRLALPLSLEHLQNAGPVSRQACPPPRHQTIG